MAKKETPTCRVQVYLTDPKVVTRLNREARRDRIPLSQAAGRAMARGLQIAAQAEPEHRLLQLERSLHDHMRSNTRDMQIVQELLIEVSRALFVLPTDPSLDQNPQVQAAIDGRVERLLNAAGGRVVAARSDRSGPASVEDGVFGAAN